MGLFSRKKTTYVSSVVYPLGEDGAERTDMLETTVLNAQLQARSASDAIAESILRGQGIALRNAFGYARDSYTDGLPTSAARFIDQPDLAVLSGILLALNKGATVSIVNTLIGTAEYEWWAERYLADTYGYDRLLAQFESPPKGVEVGANVAYDLDPDGTIQILLMNNDGKTTTVNYKPDGYVRMANVVHCAYQTQQTFDDGVTSSIRPAVAGEQDHTTYSSQVVTRTGQTLNTTTKTSVSITGSTATVTLAKTTLVTSRLKYFLYRLGSGTYPLLDAQMMTAAQTAPYYPSVPLRVDNADWTAGAHKDTPLYKTSKKLLRKVGFKIDDLADKVNSSDSIKDIDYTFVTFGMRLNSDSPEGMKYLFRYFSYLRGISSATSADFNAWANDFHSKFPTGPDASNLPAGGVQAPPINSVEIYSEKNRANNYDVKLQWQYIDTKLVSGTVKTGAKPGDVAILQGGPQVQFDLLADMVLDSSMILMRRQVDDNTYEELAISGLTYENFIYKGKSVLITAHDAMGDPEEMGFLVPLNQEILRETPMIELTNLSHQCMYLVFNCYKVVKQKWYQTTLFKIVMVIIAIVIIVVSWGSATPAVVAGMAAYFTAIGITMVLIAEILAATLYVLAMMVVMSLLSKVAIKLFGPKWGPLIAAVVSILAMNYANTGNLLGAAANSTSSLITAQNIITASSALANLYVQEQIGDVNKDINKLTKNYNNGMAKIEDLTKEYLDTSLDMIDVQGLTDSTFHKIYETPATFLNRTLITGSDVCEITSGLIENFVDVGLQLPTSG